jgi:hypothetical protein
MNNPLRGRACRPGVTSAAVVRSSQNGSCRACQGHSATVAREVRFRQYHRPDRILPAGTASLNARVPPDRPGPALFSIIEDFMPVRSRIRCSQSVSVAGTALRWATVLFLLPAGRPGPRFSVSCDIHAGGRPRRFTPPAARRSKARIASPNCFCSRRRSVRTLLMSIYPPNIGSPGDRYAAIPVIALFTI